ncbi:hypothetical protein ACIMS1_005313 [Vibrio harveyi]
MLKQLTTGLAALAFFSPAISHANYIEDTKTLTVLQLFSNATTCAKIYTQVLQEESSINNSLSFLADSGYFKRNDVSSISEFAMKNANYGANVMISGFDDLTALQKEELALAYKSDALHVKPNRLIEESDSGFFQRTTAMNNYECEFKMGVYLLMDENGLLDKYKK